MKKIGINVSVEFCSMDELNESDRALVNKAKEMTATSYSPYSCFRVGAALLMANGEVYGGSNQENAAFPDGLCAERSVFFFATANNPDVAPVVLAIAARSGDTFTPHPIAPCGSCRQALLEAEMRFKSSIRILLYGTEGVYIVDSVRSLLPLTFDGSELMK